MLQIICLQKFGGSRPTGLGGDREHKPKLKDVVERTNLYNNLAKPFTTVCAFSISS
jgi:hypothetical protein